MWELISIALLVLEAAMLASFVFGRFQKKKLNETVIFLGIVFLINLALYFLPYFYSLAQGNASNYAFDTLKKITAAVQLFLGEVDTDAVADFAADVPVFTATYLLGALLALLTTVSAAVEAFGHTIRNSFRSARILREQACDIVLGNSDTAVRYAKNNPNTLLLLGDKVDRDGAVALMDEGCTVLRQNFSGEFLNARMLNASTRYNIICPAEAESALRCIDIFIAHKTESQEQKNIYLYVEVEGSKAEMVRRELVEKNGCEEWITVFSRSELLARSLVEQQPITAHMPKSFIDEDASVKPEVKLHIFFLGFGALSEELYRQSVLNNQLVTFVRGEYRALPIHYHIYAPQAENDKWIIGGLKNALQELEENGWDGAPLPELPYRTDWLQKPPHFRDTLRAVCRTIRDENAYSFIFVDIGDSDGSMEAGARLRSMLEGRENFHLFVRSDLAYARDDERTTYYGDLDQVLTHDVIVNDSASYMAKKLHEMYTRERMQDQRGAEGFDARVKAAAEESWKKMDCFTRNSNIYSAMSLRLKLNLLGLDYARDGKGEGLELIAGKYQRPDREFAYEEYFVRSKRNALLAQEHIRWNAYHLMLEFLPLEKTGITVKSSDGQKVRFNTKNMAAKKHACITTFRGLDALSGYLAEEAGKLTGKQHKAQEYDYYVYDESLLLSAPQLMEELGCSITEK